MQLLSIFRMPPCRLPRHCLMRWDQSLAVRTTSVCATLVGAVTLAGCTVISLESPNWPSTAQGERVPASALLPASQQSAQSKATGAVESWAGHYEGTFPCADCSGIHTLLTLNRDGSYMLSMNRIGSATLPTILKGQFTWNADETEITLDGHGDYRRYRMGMRELQLLTTNGSPIRGVLNEPLVLKKR